jgi:NADH:ubiquinone oxidoreductase subunit D
MHVIRSLLKISFTVRNDEITKKVVKVKIDEMEQSLKIIEFSEDKQSVGTKKNATKKVKGG